MNVGDWLDTQMEPMTPPQRESVFAFVETLDERQAIVDESREAELRKRETSNRATQWIRELRPEPSKMGMDLRAGTDAAERAIFTSHLMQPAKALDDTIAKYSSRILTVDTCRHTFRKVSA